MSGAGTDGSIVAAGTALTGGNVTVTVESADATEIDLIGVPDNWTVSVTVESAGSGSGEGGLVARYDSDGDGEVDITEPGTIAGASAG